MRRRYDLRKSDNYMFTGRMTYVASGAGTLTVATGFPVTRAMATFSTLPLPSLGTDASSSSSSSGGGDGSDYPLPRIYVSSYTSTGFVLTYENIPEEIGYFEFSYSAV